MPGRRRLFYNERSCAGQSDAGGAVDELSGSVPLSPARWGRWLRPSQFPPAPKNADVVLRWLEAGAGESDPRHRLRRRLLRLAHLAAPVPGSRGSTSTRSAWPTPAGTTRASERDSWLWTPSGPISQPAPFDKALSLCVMEHLGDDEQVMAQRRQGPQAGRAVRPSRPIVCRMPGSGPKSERQAPASDTP
ncbi:MAG: hypothetical protein M0C28_38915 [Candidatus Moduliflexus flocculans]|nr:hypothetical protein [Candidatus Moduliflexus flocculans]